jgi:hypothetical protein
MYDDYYSIYRTLYAQLKDSYQAVAKAALEAQGASGM